MNKHQVTTVDCLGEILGMHVDACANDEEIDPRLTMLARLAYKLMDAVEVQARIRDQREEQFDAAFEKLHADLADTFADLVSHFAVELPPDRQLEQALAISRRRVERAIESVKAARERFGRDLTDGIAAEA